MTKMSFYLINKVNNKQKKKTMMGDIEQDMRSALGKTKKKTYHAENCIIQNDVDPKYIKDITTKEQ